MIINNRKATYQKNGSLGKVAIDVIANILCNITKLHIIRPLICMKVAHYTQT